MEYLRDLWLDLYYSYYTSMIFQISLKYCFFYLFADDTNIYYESDNLDKLERKVNKELGKLQLWLNVNRLSLNLSKTNYIIFHPFNKSLKHQLTIKIQKVALSQKIHIKYFGVIIDSTWSWKQQIKNITCKISRAINIMYKLRPFKFYYDEEYLLYYNLLSVYAIQVWGSAGKIETDKILVLQKRTIRLNSNKDKRPVMPCPLRLTLCSLSLKFLK